MAKVILTRWLARQFIAGQIEHQVPGLTIRALARELEYRYPGIIKHLEDGVAVAIDGEIYQNAFLEKVEPNSEVAFMPPIEGG